jgi:predicted nucleic acid-binding protein
VIVYAAGRPHPHKLDSRALIERVASGYVDGGIDAEVLQELLHRYRAIGRWAEGRVAYDLARRSFARIFSITVDVADCARGLMDLYPQLSARDALHAAVCRNEGVRTICSYDRDFDQIQGLRRVEPADVP